MMREGISKKIVLPSVLTNKTIIQLEEFITKDINEHLFYRPILSMPMEINLNDRERLAKEYQEMITNKVRPKYIELKRFLIDEYLPNSRPTTGFLDIPYGKETYEYLIKLHTTTNMTC